MITINDVAKRAGVSKGTVSSVFSQKRHVSPEIAERVKKAARELNYQPNPIAKSLATKQTMTIGIKMPVYKGYELSYFETQVIYGVIEKCSQNGYRVLLDRVEMNGANHNTSDPVDGVILLNPLTEDPRFMQYQRLNIPYVLIGKPEKENADIYYVDNNNKEIVREVGEYLIENGHQRILFLNADKSMTVTDERKEGLEEAFQNYSLAFSDELVLNHNQTKYNSAFMYGYKSMMENFKKGKFTAVITDTDRVGLGVLRAATELGLDIPTDLSIVALSNNDRLASETTPQITSVELFPDKLGEESAETLLSLLNKRPTPKRKIIRAQTVIRQT